MHKLWRAPNRWLIALAACTTAGALLLVSETSYRRSIGTLDALGQMIDAPVNIEGLRWAMLDSQMAAREYQLTGSANYLELHAEADQRIGRNFAFLDQYFAGAAVPQAALDDLHALARAQADDFTRVLRRRAAGDRDVSPERASRIRGQDQMDAARARSGQLLGYEAADVAGSRGHLYRTLLLGRVGVLALSVLGLLAVFFLLRHMQARARELQERQRAARAERDGLEREVVQRTAQLTALTRHLQTAREDERSRLARDLHDELGALLTSAKLDAARLKSRIPADASEARDRLQHLVSMLNGVIALKRRIIEDLRPSALANLGLTATLEILAREFTSSSGIAVHCAFEPVQLGAAGDLVAFRIVQEATTNIAKYARAANVWLSLSRSDGHVDISVRDDGIGFDPQANAGSAHGLLGMRYRVEAAGGVLRVESAHGKDTRILARLPEALATPA